MERASGSGSMRRRAWAGQSRSVVEEVLGPYNTLHLRCKQSESTGTPGEPPNADVTPKPSLQSPHEEPSLQFYMDKYKTFWESFCAERVDKVMKILLTKSVKFGIMTLQEVDQHILERILNPSFAKEYTMLRVGRGVHNTSESVLGVLACVRDHGDFDSLSSNTIKPTATLRNVILYDKTKYTLESNEVLPPAANEKHPGGGNLLKAVFKHNETRETFALMTAHLSAGDTEKDVQERQNIIDAVERTGGQRFKIFAADFNDKMNHPSGWEALYTNENNALSCVKIRSVLSDQPSKIGGHDMKLIDNVWTRECESLKCSKKAYPLDGNKKDEDGNNIEMNLEWLYTNRNETMLPNKHIPSDHVFIAADIQLTDNIKSKVNLFQWNVLAKCLEDDGFLAFEEPDIATYYAILNASSEFKKKLETKKKEKRVDKLPEDEQKDAIKKLGKSELKEFLKTYKPKPFKIG